MKQILINNLEGLGVYPFIALEESTNKVFVQGGITKVANVGDILLYNKIDSKFELVNGDENLSEYSTSIYSPVGVVMIPSNHDLYGTGEFTVISLKYMDDANPDTGNNNAVKLYWGQSNYDVPELNNFNKSEYGFLPSTNFTSGDLCDDGISRYSSSTPHLPSPYNADGTFNSNYLTSMLSDVDGKTNTNMMMTHVTVNWQSGTIKIPYSTTDKGHFPTACCCRRYSVLGTNPGDWYLGSAGEMGYMIARFAELNKSLTKINNKFGNASTLTDAFNYWCSTECQNNYAVSVYPYYGRVYSYSKDYYYVVRALLRVPLSSI